MPNATLTDVAAGGQAEDYERGPSAGPSKWSGAEGVYFTEVAERAVGEASTLVIRRSVLAPADLPVEFSDGDTITLSTEAGALSEPVRRIQRTSYPGAPGVVRLHLEDG